MVLGWLIVEAGSDAIRGGIRDPRSNLYSGSPTVGETIDGLCGGIFSGAFSESTYCGPTYEERKIIERGRLKRESEEVVARFHKSEFGKKFEERYEEKYGWQTYIKLVFSVIMAKYRYMPVFEPYIRIQEDKERLVKAHDPQQIMELAEFYKDKPLRKQIMDSLLDTWYAIHDHHIHTYKELTHSARREIESLLSVVNLYKEAPEEVTLTVLDSIRAPYLEAAIKSGEVGDLRPVYRSIPVRELAEKYKQRLPMAVLTTIYEEILRHGPYYGEREEDFNSNIHKLEGLMDKIARLSWLYDGHPTAMGGAIRKVVSAVVDNGTTGYTMPIVALEQICALSEKYPHLPRCALRAIHYGFYDRYLSAGNIVYGMSGLEKVIDDVCFLTELHSDDPLKMWHAVQKVAFSAMFGDAEETQKIAAEEMRKAAAWE